MKLYIYKVVYVTLKKIIKEITIFQDDTC